MKRMAAPSDTQFFLFIVGTILLYVVLCFAIGVPRAIFNKLKREWYMQPRPHFLRRRETEQLPAVSPKTSSFQKALKRCFSPKT